MLSNFLGVVVLFIESLVSFAYCLESLIESHVSTNVKESLHVLFLVHQSLFFVIVFKALFFLLLYKQTISILQLRYELFEERVFFFDFEL
jgi:hypothetical protein